LPDGLREWGAWEENGKSFAPGFFDRPGALFLIGDGVA
jgi:hypothetical protein